MMTNGQARVTMGRRYGDAWGVCVETRDILTTDDARVLMSEIAERIAECERRNRREHAERLERASRPTTFIPRADVLDADGRVDYRALKDYPS